MAARLSLAASIALTAITLATPRELMAQDRPDLRDQPNLEALSASTTAEAPPAIQSPPPGLNDWARVQALAPGRLVIGRKTGSWLFPKGVQGEFVSATQDSITLKADETQRTLSQVEIKDLSAIKVGRENSYRTGRKLALAGTIALTALAAVDLVRTVQDVKAVSNGRFPRQQSVGLVYYGVAGGVAITGAIKARKAIEKLFKAR